METTSGAKGDQTPGEVRPSLHESRLSSGFPRLLLEEPATGIADQSLAGRISRSIIYTSVKSTHSYRRL